MQFPEDLKYAANDEWARVEGDLVTVGVTDYAQDQLSDIVYFEITVDEESEVSKGDAFAILESVKAASDVYAPVSGTVVQANSDLASSPELVNSDPYGEAWMIVLRLSDANELEELMDAAAYQQNVQERSA